MQVFDGGDGSIGTFVSPTTGLSNHAEPAGHKSAGLSLGRELVIGTNLNVDASTLPTPDACDSAVEHRFEMDDEGAKMLLNTLPIHVSRNIEAFYSSCCSVSPNFLFPDPPSILFADA